MFGKKKKNYDLTYENLASPEIHTHEAPEQEQTAQAEEKHEKETHKPGVVYDSVAIPEVHIKKK